jgi:hypothetical protein
VLSGLFVTSCDKNVSKAVSDADLSVDIQDDTRLSPPQIQFIVRNGSDRPVCIEGGQSIAALSPLRFTQNGITVPFKAFSNFKPKMYKSINLAQPIYVALPSKTVMLTIDLDDMDLRPGKIMIEGELLAYDCESIFSQGQPIAKKVFIKQEIELR